MPKYHKDNLYYSLVMFNNDAFVASTRIITCNSPNNDAFSNTNASYSNAHDSSKDSIWDDSFSFDNLPLDVKEIKLCLFVIGKSSKFSASFVNNLKKISSSAGSNSKMLDPLLIGCVTIKLDELMNKGLVEQWYNVEPAVQIASQTTNFDAQSANGNMNESSSGNCTLRVKIRFCEEKIYLNKNHYQQLCSFLSDEAEHKHICMLYDQIMPSTERPHFVQALLKFFIAQNKIVEMLKSFLIAEIDRCSDLSTLFRPATMCTSLMDHYMRTRCDEFLRKAIQEPLVRILKPSASGTGVNPSNGHYNSNGLNALNLSVSSGSSQPKSFELDPTKCADQHQRELNLVHFQLALKDLISSICSQSTVSLFPNELKYLFCLVRQNVHLKWLKQQQQQQQQQGEPPKTAEIYSEKNANPKSLSTDEKLVKIYCVSAFVFLRLLCPALLNPKNFGLKFSNSIRNTPQSAQFMPSPSDSLLSNRINNNSFNFYDLGMQFSVFSPAFMFSLSPHNSQLEAPSTSLAAATGSSLSLLNQSVNCFNVSSLLVLSNPINPLMSTGTSQQLALSSSTASMQSSALHERQIKLLAKVLQTLANMTECKEPFMNPLSEFLNSNKLNIIKFIEDISNLSEFNSKPLFKLNDLGYDETFFVRNFNLSKENFRRSIENEIKNQFENATCKYMAILHRLLNSFVPQMKSYILKSAASGQNMDEFMIEDCKLNENETGFINSMQRLINILNDINNKTK